MIFFLEKCKNYGLRGRINDLLRSYLSDRGQVVGVDDVDSIMAPVYRMVYYSSMRGQNDDIKLILTPLPHLRLCRTALPVGSQCSTNQRLWHIRDAF